VALGSSGVFQSLPRQTVKKSPVTAKTPISRWLISHFAAARKHLQIDFNTTSRPISSLRRRRASIHCARTVPKNYRRHRQHGNSGKPSPVLPTRAPGPWTSKRRRPGRRSRQKDGGPQSCETTATTPSRQFNRFPVFRRPAFAWADFDSDGNRDAAIVDGAGHLSHLSHERKLNFAKLPCRDLPAIKALSVADTDNDGF